jgi:hypothetical protein
LDYADDLALLGRDVESTNINTVRLSNEARKVGLEINRDKTKVMIMHGDDATPVELDGEIIEKVDSFTYLGSTVCRDGDVMVARYAEMVM